MEIALYCIASAPSQPPFSVITASDYAVFVQGLPRDATEEEILEHFNQLYDLRKPDWVFPSSCNR